MRFAEWWGTRVYHFCRADIPNGLFTDQRWIDFVPAFFEGVGIIRSSRHNVATWNLTTREMTGSLEAGIKVDGQSLGFYHFTGFDSGAHRQMASKNAEGNRSVGELIEWYGRQTADAGRDPLAQVPWAYGQFANGEPISKAQRLVFRNRIDLQRDFPDPFNSQGPRSYYDWWENRAPIEYPGLFEAQGESEILASLSKGVSPVFRRASAGTRWSLDG